MKAEDLVSTPGLTTNTPEPDPYPSESRGMKEWSEWKKTGSKESFASLVKVMGPTIEGVTKANPKLSPSIMRSKAKSALYSAAQTYDPSVGTSFSTHAHNHLKPLMIRSHGETRAIPKGRFVEEAAKDYKRAYDEFSEDHLREPTADEMADIMKISRDRSSELMRRIYSYEVPEGSMEGGIIPEENTAENRRLRMWTEYVYQGLTPRDKLIMDYRLGRNGKPQLGLEEIARKTGVSTTMAHKVLKKISDDIIDGVNTRTPVQIETSTPELESSDEDLLPGSGNRA